jgi:hypothetical protein
MRQTPKRAFQWLCCTSATANPSIETAVFLSRVPTCPVLGEAGSFKDQEKAAEGSLRNAKIRLTDFDLRKVQWPRSSSPTRAPTRDSPVI